MRSRLLLTAERAVDDLLDPPLLSAEDALCIAQDLVANEFRAACARNRPTVQQSETIAQLLEDDATAETIAGTVGIPVNDADTIVKFFKMVCP
jgi:hypothetical protein